MLAVLVVRVQHHQLQELRSLMQAAVVVMLTLVLAAQGVLEVVVRVL